MLGVLVGVLLVGYAVGLAEVGWFVVRLEVVGFIVVGVAVIAGMETGIKVFVIGMMGLSKSLYTLIELV